MSTDNINEKVLEKNKISELDDFKLKNEINSKISISNIDSTDVNFPKISTYFAENIDIKEKNKDLSKVASSAKSSLVRIISLLIDLKYVFYYIG
jgi:hypothetical protein